MTAHVELTYLPDTLDKKAIMTPSALNCAAREVARAMHLHDIQHANPAGKVPRQDTRKEWLLLKPNGAKAASLAVHCSPSSGKPNSPYTAAVLISRHAPVILLEANEGVTDHKVAREVMMRAFVRWALELRLDQSQLPVRT